MGEATVRGSSAGPFGSIGLSSSLVTPWLWPRRLVWWILLAGAVPVGIYSMRFLLPITPHLLKAMRLNVIHPDTLLVHSVAGSLALLAGPWQMLASVRRKAPALHRWLGRFYVASVGVGWVASLVLTPWATGGLPSAAAFGAGGALWMGFCVAGISAVRRGDLRAHRRWMLRSYALTWAPVTIRPYVGLAVMLDAPFPVALAIGLWLSCITNLLLVEAWLARRNRDAGIQFSS